MSASPHCTARAARRMARIPEAPPKGSCSSQRTDMLKCWVRKLTESGARLKLEIARPSTSALSMPAAAINSRSTLPINQRALCSLVLL